MSISIHELLAVARESEGVKAVQGDAMLCEKRFAPDTRYMVEFLVLKQTEKFGEKGEYIIVTFNKGSILRNGGVTETGYPSFSKTGACFRGNTALSSSPSIFQD